MGREPQPITIQLGTQDEWSVQLIAEDGQTLSPFVQADAIAGTVGQGPGLPALFAPTTTWIDPVLKQILLAITPAQMTAVAVGVYPIDIWVTRVADSKKRLGWSGWLDVTSAAVGTGTAGKVYGSYQDLLDFAGDWLPTLRQENTQANFLRARVRARQWLDQVILAHVPPTMASRGDILYGLNLFGPAEARSRQIRLWLDSDFLMLTPERTEIVSRKAIALICEDQIGTEDPDPWAVRSVRYHRGAGNLTRGYIAEIDVNADGIADYAFHCGQFKMRRD